MTVLKNNEVMLSRRDKNSREAVYINRRQARRRNIGAGDRGKAIKRRGIQTACGCSQIWASGFSFFDQVNLRSVFFTLANSLASSSVPLS